MNIKVKLAAIRDRYYRKVSAGRGIFHHGDCEIYRSLNVWGSAPCMCGLIHDLTLLPDGLAMKLYPKFWDDKKRSDRVYDAVYSNDGIFNVNYREPPLHATHTPEALEKLLHSIFGGVKEIEVDDEAEWALIESVFGTREVAIQEKGGDVKF